MCHFSQQNSDLKEMATQAPTPTQKQHVPLTGDITSPLAVMCQSATFLKIVFVCRLINYVRNSPLSLITITSDRSQDLSGLRCPHLLIATIRAMEKLYEGQRLQIIATDLNAPSSITAWAKQSGNKLIDLYDEDGTFTFILQRQNINSSSPSPILSTKSEKKGRIYE